MSVIWLYENGCKMPLSFHSGAHLTVVIGIILKGEIALLGRLKDDRGKTALFEKEDPFIKTVLQDLLPNPLYFQDLAPLLRPQELEKDLATMKRQSPGLWPILKQKSSHVLKVISKSMKIAIIGVLIATRCRLC